MRKKIEVEINGMKHSITLVDGDAIAILSLFYYTKEERKELCAGKIGFADTQLQRRLMELAEVETETLQAELAKADKELPASAFSDEVAARVARNISATFLIRIQMDFDERREAVQRLREMLPECKELWYRNEGDFGLRLESDEITNIAVSVFKAYPPQLLERTEEAAPEAAIAAPESETEPVVEVPVLEAEATPSAEPSFEESLAARLRSIGLSDDAIAKMVAIAEEPTAA